MLINPISANYPIHTFKNKQIETPTDKIALNINEEKRNQILKDGFLVTGGLLFANLLAVALLASTKGGKSSSSTPHKTKEILIDFKSLSNAEEIPTLENCKSVDEKLRKFFERQSKLGNKANRIMLYGPPGVGKTFFSKVYAKSIGADFLELKFSDFNSSFAGEDIEYLQSIFEQILNTAKRHPDKKFVVAFNEIDTSIQSIEHLSTAKLSGHIMSKIEERGTILNYLDVLNEEAPNVIIIGTTNQSAKNGSLDGAVLSRFKKNLVEIDFPDTNLLSEALKNRLVAYKQKSFVQNNEDEIIKFAQSLQERHCSFRDLNVVVENAVDEHTIENEKNFNIKYLEKALKELELTDGEIYLGKKGE